LIVATGGGGIGLQQQQQQHLLGVCCWSCFVSLLKVSALQFWFVFDCCCNGSAECRCNNNNNNFSSMLQIKDAPLIELSTSFEVIRRIKRTLPKQSSAACAKKALKRPLQITLKTIFGGCD
jgi:hypothetical protein